jgi:hypothetical protein
MTWDEILALDDHALNLALETHVYHHQWAALPPCPIDPRQLWMLDQDGLPTYATVPHLHTTTDWEACMGLAFRYEIGLWPCRADDGGWVIQHPATDGYALRARTEAQARRAICHLALWLVQESRERQRKQGP